VADLFDGSLHFGIAGVRQVGSPSALAISDLMAVGSNGKAMTAMVAVRVVEHGALRWDSKVVDVIPGARAASLDVYGGVTLEQLLNHRGGIWPFQSDEDYLELLSTLEGPLPTTLEAQRGLFARQVLTVAPRPGVVPGMTPSYSNGGYTAAGAMLEAVTGRSFEALHDMLLSRPLGLPGHIGAPRDADAQQPVGHIGSPGRMDPFAGYEGLQRTMIDITAPSGNASTTAQGYGGWLQQHLNAFAGRSHRLPAEYVERLRALDNDDYALGWQRTTLAGHPVYTHSGSEFAFQMVAVISADGSRALFAMTNATTLDADNWVARTLQEAVLAQLS
jgi:CubicO group peptidase (beta-lactamase class C family)